MDTASTPVMPEAEQLPATLQALIDTLEQEKPTTPMTMRRILKAAEVDETDLVHWHAFNHDPADSYGRKMIYNGGEYEIMLMSWNPGDISAIHDHGYTQWGAVKVFGEAEHAIFILQDNTIRTLNRLMLKPGHVMGVGHDMVHQMGCPKDGTPFISLHIYGSKSHKGHVTGDARLYDLASQKVHTLDGGAFYAVPEVSIKSSTPAPDSDFATALRDEVQLSRLLRRSHQDATALTEGIFRTERVDRLREDLEDLIDDEGHSTASLYWQHLCWELSEAADLQREMEREAESANDSFANYAALYDAVIGRPCLQNFMAGYLKFFIDKYNIDLGSSTMLSIGCGTGLVEEYMIRELGMDTGKLLGIDLSPAMVEVASKRINAEEGNALDLDPAVRQWDLAFCGLNVLQYIGHTDMQAVIKQVSAILNPGGYFIGDFITPDHIRWYPNVLYSEDRKIISLRTPRLIERNQYTYQQSHIINVDATGERLRITDEGLHDRFLPPLHRIRHYFEQGFEEVHLFDAVKLTAIDPMADTCASTRYIVIARKGLA